MSSSLAPFSSLIPSPLAPRFLQTLTQFPNSPFLSSCSFLRLKNAFLLNLRTRIAPLQPQRVRSKTHVLSAQSSFLKVLRTAWNIGKDGIEAGTNLVPVSVPRSVARISVTIAALAVSLFVVKSFLSTAFFVLVCNATPSLFVDSFSVFTKLNYYELFACTWYNPILLDLSLGDI
ncbi:PREDICTED: uncharacterized protein LOC104759382 [Camelina sativa]|uniref:Uncharacterized protein LOC104759382 n=1 Tax=Camelina sativa TaxID=90675 RepID=A0ABM0X4Q0_CAMSA|nr:PREDICTED: uncharacterized protein LOC104759382 [Camelina sativa]